MKKVAITPEVASILSRATVEGNAVRLPDEQLDRPLYEAVDKVLKALGGKWNRSARGHVFAAGIGDQLGEALAAGHAVDLKKTHEQFFTPAALAAEMVALAEIQPGMTVLEPSAGGGGLIEAVAQAHSTAIIYAIELDEGLCAALRTKWGGRAVVDQGDFLSLPATLRPIDRVLMNPPFSNGQDVEHVRHAFGMLSPGGKLVAIMSPHPFFAKDRRSAEFRQWLQHHQGGFRALPAGTFSESGTNVGTYLVSVTKPDPAA